jgi:hypothetical protein
MSENPSMRAAESSANLTLASRQAWGLVFAVLLLYLLLRWVAGPLPQWLDYHDFADTRVLGFVPRAGDVLTNLAILAAGLWSASLRHRVCVSRDERPAFRLLVAGAILTAFGSAYYHWDPSNARLVWDRLPLALLLTAIVSLVLADRVTPAFGRAALLPVGSLAVGSVALWGLTEAFGRGDLWLYLLVRIGASIGILVLLITRRSRYTVAALVWMAVACDGLETAAEHFDWQIWRLTDGVVSGHNLKHLFAGAVIACVSGWLLQRRPVRTRGDHRIESRAEHAGRRG